MELELLEEFIRGLCPSEASVPVNKLFTGLKEDPVQMVLQGLSHIATDIRENGAAGIATVNGLCLGVALAYGSRTSKDLKMIIESYNLRNARGRGENVVDFFKARAGKAKS